MKKLALSFLVISRLAAATEIWPSVSVCSAAEFPNRVKKKIEVATGVSIEAGFEITSKGNGVVEVPGLSVRVYDTHDDGLVFRNRILRCEWQREGDTFEFVVSGFADRTEGKKESNPVRGVFRYSAKARRFEPVSCSPHIYFWRSTEPNQAPEPTAATGRGSS
jgi:hypothetical protein